MENEDKPSWQHCLEALLAMPIGSRSLKEAVAAGDAAAIEATSGLILDEGRLLIPHDNPTLSAYFRGTSWMNGIWVMALRTAPPEIAETEEVPVPDIDPAGLRPPVMKTRYRVSLDASVILAFDAT